MKSGVIKNGLTGLSVLIIVCASLATGIGLQAQSLEYVIKAFAFIALATVWLFTKGFSLPRVLVLFCVMYLLPIFNMFIFAMFMLVLVFLADLSMSSKRQLLIPYPLCFLVLIAFGLVALSKTYVTDGVPYFISTIIVPLVCFVAIINARPDRAALSIWMRGISVIAAIVATIGIYLALTNPTQRIGSTWSTAMTINGFYALAFFFSAGLAFRAASMSSRLAWIIAAVLIFLGMLFTYTRMAMLAVVFGMLLLILRYRNFRIWGLLLIGLIPLLIPSSKMNRGEVVSMIDISILIRFIAWYKASFIIAEHPLTGIGFSTWMDIYHNMIPLPFLYAQHTHNVYINLLVEMGVLGTLAYLAIIFKGMRNYYLSAIKGCDDMQAFCVWTGMLSLLFACLTDIFIQQYSISFLFWITLALMVKESSLPQEKVVESCHA